MRARKIAIGIAVAAFWGCATGPTAEMTSAPVTGRSGLEKVWIQALGLE